MRRRLHLVPFAATAIVVASCNALTGVDSLSIDQSTPPTSVADADPVVRNDGSTTPGVMLPDGSAPDVGSMHDDASVIQDAASDQAAQDAGNGTAIVRETFATSLPCTSAVVAINTTTTWESGAGSSHDSEGGACRVCATAAGSLAMTISTTIPFSGQLTMSAWVRWVQDKTQPTNTRAVVNVGGSTSPVLTTLDATYKSLATASPLNATAGQSLDVTFRSLSVAAGDCVVVDDITVLLK